MSRRLRLAVAAALSVCGGLLGAWAGGAAVSAAGAAGTGSGPSRPALRADTATGRTWAPPASDQDRGQGIQLNQLSCPTTTQCSAIDSDGRVLTYDPQSPGTPQPQTIDAGGGLAYISCPTVSQCTTLDNDGYEITFDPVSPGNILADAQVNTQGDGSQGLTCVSANECVASVAQGSEVTFDPTAPSGATPVDDGHTMEDLTCPLAHQCVGIDASATDNIITFDPQSPATFVESPIGSSSVDAVSLSCLPATGDTAQCTVVLHFDAQAITFDTGAADTTATATVTGTATTPYASADPSVACATTSLCTIIAAGAHESSLDPVTATTVTAGPVIDAVGTPGDVVCPGAGECVAVGEYGESVTYDPAAPGNDGATPILSGTALNAAACLTIMDCTAVEGSDAIAFSASSPAAGTAVSIDPGSTLYAVSCIPGGTQCVGVGSNGDEVTYDPAAPTAAPVTVDPAEGNLNAIDCVSASLCVAVGEAGNEGREVAFDPAAADPAAGATVAMVGTGGTLYGVSCVDGTPVRCTATDGDGGFVTFDPADPSAATTSAAIDSSETLGGISCPSATQCTAVAGNGGPYATSTFITFDPQDVGDPAVGTTWGTVDGLRSVFCPSVSECVAVGSSGGAGLFDPNQTGSLTPVNVDSDDGTLYSVTCLDVSGTEQCVAVDGDGEETTFDPTAVPVVTSLDTGTSLSGIACGGVAVCETADALGDAAWLAPGTAGTIEGKNVQTALTGIACPSSGMCVGVGGDQATQFAATPSASSTNGAVAIDPGEELTAVGCSSATDCVATDGYGGVLDFDPASTTVPARTQIDAPNVVDAIACVTGASPAQCTAVDDNGGVLTFDPDAVGTPTRVVVDTGKALDGVSCPSQAQCTAVDSSGNEVTFDPAGSGGATNVTVQAVDPSGGGLSAVSCAATDDCVAVDGGGNAVEGDPETSSSWAIEPTRLDAPLVGVSCPAVDECVVADADAVVVGTGETSPSGGGTATTGTTATGGAATTTTEPATNPGATATATTPATGTTAGGATTTGTATRTTAATASVSGKVTSGHGRVSVRISCRGVRAATCRVTVTLTVVETLRHAKVVAVSARSAAGARAGTVRRTVVIGRAAASISGGRVRVVTVTLDAAGRALLLRRATLRAHLAVSARSGHGHASTIATRVVTLTRR